MTKILWQLKRPSTNETLNEPQELPPSWKNITGLTSLAVRGETARLNNLSWAGHEDIGWFEVGPVPEPVVDKAQIVKDQIQHFLNETADKVSIENAAITKGERIVWMEYRQKLKELHLKPGFPDEVFWPTRPE